MLKNNVKKKTIKLLEIHFSLPSFEIHFAASTFFFNGFFITWLVLTQRIYLSMTFCFLFDFWLDKLTLPCFLKRENMYLPRGKHQRFRQLVFIKRKNRYSLHSHYIPLMSGNFLCCLVNFFP